MKTANLFSHEGSLLVGWKHTKKHFFTIKAKARMPIGSMSIQCKHRDKRDKDCMIHLMYTSNQSERVHTCTGPIFVALYIYIIYYI